MSLYHHHHCPLNEASFVIITFILTEQDALAPCLAESAVSSLPTAELSSRSPLAWLPGREHTPANALTALSAQLDEKVFPSRGKTFAAHNRRWKGDIICNHPTVIEYVLYLCWKQKQKQKKSNAFLRHMVVLVKTTPSGVVKWSIHMILAARRLGLQLRLRCQNRGSSNITAESTEWLLFIFPLSCVALLVLLWLFFCRRYFNSLLHDDFRSPHILIQLCKTTTNKH